MTDTAKLASVLIFAATVMIAERVVVWLLIRQYTKRVRQQLVMLLEMAQNYPLDDQDTCMCGSPVKYHHPLSDNHAPVSVADHSRGLIVEHLQHMLKSHK